MADDKVLQQGLERHREIFEPSHLPFEDLETQGHMTNELPARAVADLPPPPLAALSPPLSLIISLFVVCRLTDLMTIFATSMAKSYLLDAGLWSAANKEPACA